MRSPRSQREANTREAAIRHPAPHAASRRGRILELWTPEDRDFWLQEGRAIANLNLWISIPALFLAFAVWMVWSAIVVQLPAVGFRYTTDQLF